MKWIQITIYKMFLFFQCFLLNCNTTLATAWCMYYSAHCILYLHFTHTKYAATFSYLHFKSCHINSKYCVVVNPRYITSHWLIFRANSVRLRFLLFLQKQLQSVQKKFIYIPKCCCLYLIRIIPCYQQFKILLNLNFLL